MTLSHARTKIVHANPSKFKPRLTTQPKNKGKLSLDKTKKNCKPKNNKDPQKDLINL